MSNLLGQYLGRYPILEQLGVLAGTMCFAKNGRMVTVYKTYDMRFETDMPVKVVRTDWFSSLFSSGKKLR